MLRYVAVAGMLLALADALKLIPPALGALAMPAIGLGLLGGNVASSLNASGAFEVIDVATGRTLASKLATGQVPSVAAVLAQLPPADAATAGGGKHDDDE